MSIDEWMDREKVVYTGTEILFKLKKEGNSATYNNVYEPGGYNIKWNKPVTEGQYCMITLTWSI